MVYLTGRDGYHQQNGGSVKFTEYLAEGERASDEEKGHHDRALRYTGREWGAVDFSDAWWINCM